MHKCSALSRNRTIIALLLLQVHKLKRKAEVTFTEFGTNFQAVGLHSMLLESFLVS